MLKEKAVASLGQASLLLPAWIRAALAANDRLKLYLSLLQAAAQHAKSPDSPIADWGSDLGEAGPENTDWVRDMVRTTYLDDGVLVVAGLDKLVAALQRDLSVMARPLCDSPGHEHTDFSARRDFWLARLQSIDQAEGLSPKAISDLTHGSRSGSDSFHLLVMDLHKELNVMSTSLSTEEIDGAHVWQIEPDDRPLVQAFMKGLHHTAPLKFSHPGLDTAVTRDSARLLIQNDIGTNDAHVLVVEVEGNHVRLTYSDLHTERFAFFQRMLAEIGFSWTVFEPVTTGGLNDGKPYTMGRATIKRENRSDLLVVLEAMASRIVFVIDWNRARKRLQNFVRKPQAVALLQLAAANEWGHMAWLLAGGERLVYGAMQAVDSEAFRIGDRLDDVLGQGPANEFLLSLLRVSSVMLLRQQPVSLVADQARLLLARALRQRTFEFDLLGEHAAYCHALAQALCSALDSPGPWNEQASAELQVRAKAWERHADHLLVDARQRAQRHARWLQMLNLLEKSDDVADGLEEALFVVSMTQRPPVSGLPAPVTDVVRRLAAETLAAIQDLVKAIEIARHLSEGSDAQDNEAFLQTIWRIVRSERQCDDLQRQARLSILAHLHTSPAAFYLANELAATIETVSDHLLAMGHALRGLVFERTGLPS